MPCFNYLVLNVLFVHFVKFGISKVINKMKIENGNNFDLSNTENFEPLRNNNNLVRFIVSFAIISIFGFGVYWFYFKKDDLSRLEQSLGLEKDGDSEEVKFDSSNVVIDEAFSSKPKYEGVVHISENQNVYYVVIGSFIDKDLAIDYANTLAKSNSTVYVINKRKLGSYTYIALECFNQEKDAKDKAKSIAGTYQHGAWVLFH